MSMCRNIDRRWSRGVENVRNGGRENLIGSLSIILAMKGKCLSSVGPSGCPAMITGIGIREPIANMSLGAGHRGSKGLLIG